MDGTPLKGKSYFVLRLDSDNPAEAARVNAAMRAYKGGLRNCDRFMNEAEARKAFIVWYNTVYELNGDRWNEVSSCDLKHNVDDILQDYIEWLFALETEKCAKT